jgi:hypothetical protein
MCSGPGERQIICNYFNEDYVAHSAYAHLLTGRTPLTQLDVLHRSLDRLERFARACPVVDAPLSFAPLSRVDNQQREMESCLKRVRTERVHQRYLNLFLREWLEGDEQPHPHWLQMPESRQFWEWVLRRDDYTAVYTVAGHFNHRESSMSPWQVAQYKVMNGFRNYESSLRYILFQ